MLVCYLDDSGKDPQNPVTTLAGYAATDMQWAAFEGAVEPVFKKHSVDVLHAKDLHHTDGEFAGWSGVKKHEFIRDLSTIMADHIPFGMSVCVVKQQYANRAVEYKNRRDKLRKKRVATPHAFCLNVIIDWVLHDIRVGRVANTEGVAFVLESGHENNPDADKTFDEVRRLHNLESTLRSISFVGKDACRAIQLADLCAFYSRRHGVAVERAPGDDKLTVPLSSIFNILTGSVPHRVFVVTDVSEEEFGPPFFADGA